MAAACTEEWANHRTGIKEFMSSLKLLQYEMPRKGSLLSIHLPLCFAQSVQILHACACISVSALNKDRTTGPWWMQIVFSSEVHLATGFTSVRSLSFRGEIKPL